MAACKIVSPSAIKGKLNILNLPLIFARRHNKLSHKMSEGGRNTQISAFSSLLLSILLFLLSSKLPAQ
jgi:hypothetical protein